jgi:hypothetical protein
LTALGSLGSGERKEEEEAEEEEGVGVRVVWALAALPGEKGEESPPLRAWKGDCG